MYRGKAHAAYPSHPTDYRQLPGVTGTCYACKLPVQWDGRRWTHLAPVKGKR